MDQLFHLSPHAVPLSSWQPPNASRLREELQLERAHLPSDTGTTEEERRREAARNASAAAAVSGSAPVDGDDTAAPTARPLQRRVRLNVTRPVATEEPSDDSSSDDEAESEAATEDATETETATHATAATPAAVVSGPSTEALLAEAAAAARRDDGQPTPRDLMQRLRKTKPAWTRETVTVTRPADLQAARANLPVVREEYRVREWHFMVGFGVCGRGEGGGGTVARGTGRAIEIVVVVC